MSGFGRHEPLVPWSLMRTHPAVLLTSPKPESKAPRSYLQTGPFPQRISCVFKLFRTPLHPYKSAILLFSIDSELLVQNTRGWGGCCFLRYPLNFPASLLPPSVPLRPHSLGATMSKRPPGTTGKGKHIAPDRCLRLESGHPGLAGIADPDSVGIASRAWVIVLARGISTMARQQGGPQPASHKDATFASILTGCIPRAGKAGSVRLG